MQEFQLQYSSSQKAERQKISGFTIWGQMDTPLMIKGLRLIEKGIFLMLSSGSGSAKRKIRSIGKENVSTCQRTKSKLTITIFQFPGIKRSNMKKPGKKNLRL